MESWNGLGGRDLKAHLGQGQLPLGQDAQGERRRDHLGPAGRSSKTQL